MKFLLVCVLFAGVSWGAVELVAYKLGAVYRPPLLWGWASGLAVNVCALPFVLKTAGLDKSAVRGGAGLNWWLVSFIARLVALALLMAVLRVELKNSGASATYALIAVYFSGLILELIWLAPRMWAADDRGK